MYRPSPHGHMAGLALRIFLLANLDLPLRFRLLSAHSLRLVVTATVFLCFIP